MDDTISVCLVLGVSLLKNC